MWLNILNSFSQSNLNLANETLMKVLTNRNVTLKKELQNLAMNETKQKTI
jgi:hypothetical protein